MAQKLLLDNWYKIRSQLCKWWSDLTDEDLDQVNGSQEQLIHILQERYSYTRNLAVFEIEKHLAMYYSLEIHDQFHGRYKDGFSSTSPWNEREKEFTRMIRYRSKYLWKDDSSTKLFLLLEKHMYVFRQKRAHLPESLAISSY